MKPFVTGLIVCSVAILFVLWNRRFIFGGAKTKTKTKTKISSAKSIKLPAAVSNEEDATAMLLSELLSLNRALFCKNLGRPPRIGRVVRIVESENEKADKYIIELVK